MLGNNWNEKEERCKKVAGFLFFMHTGVQMKYVSKLTDARRTSSGKGRSPTRLKKYYYLAISSIISPTYMVCMSPS